MNITDPIWRYAETCPDRAALFCAGQVQSFAALCTGADSVAWHLAKAGIESGQRVAVTVANPLMHLVVVLALARMGAISAAVAHNLPADAQGELAQQCGVSAYVRSDAAWKLGGISDAAHILTGGLLGDGSPAPNAIPVPADSGGRPWRISLSSGTTGTPKGVAWTHEHASRLIRLMQTVFPSGPSERLLMLLDPSTNFAMNQTLRQLCAGGAVVVPRMIDSAEFFTCVKRDRVTQVMTSNAHAWNLLQYAKKSGQAETEASQRLRCFAVGGSALSATMRAELRNRICANLYISYGSTEGGLLARADPDSLQQFPGATGGYLMPWVEAETVDDEGTVLPRGSPGNLRFRIPAMASGYEGDAEATAKVFRDGWYYPGDTGTIDSRGLLTLGARADDLINLAGTKIDPTAIEAVLNQDPSVRESVVVAAVTERGALVLVAVVVALQPIDAEALRAKCRERLGLLLMPARIVTVDRLPRNAEGKLLRREVAAMVRAQPAPPKEAGDASRTH
jgi:acyl-coenzyme A synthetase/AMP-(fatty) acid ligase